MAIDFFAAPSNSSCFDLVPGLENVEDYSDYELQLGYYITLILAPFSVSHMSSLQILWLTQAMRNRVEGH